MTNTTHNTYPIQSLVLGGVSIIAGIWFWFLFKGMTVSGNFETVPILYAVFLLSCSFIPLSLLFLFAEHIWLIIIPFLFSIAPLLFMFGYTPLVVASMALAAIGVIRAYARIRAEAQSRINFRVSILLREGLPFVLTMFSLLLAVTYYTETNRVPKRIIMQNIVPRALFETILKHMPTNLNGSALPKDILYDIVTQKSEQFLAPYERFVPIGFAAAFFLFLRTIAFPFGWILIWVCGGIVYIGKTNGLLTRFEEPTTKERVKWS